MAKLALKILRDVLLLPRDALQCKARSCYRMSSVRPSVCPSVCLSVTLVDHDHIQGRNFGPKSGGPRLRHLVAEDRDAEGVERDEEWEGTPLPAD